MWLMTFSFLFLSGKSQQHGSQQTQSQLSPRQDTAEGNYIEPIQVQVAGFKTNGDQEGERISLGW